MNPCPSCPFLANNHKEFGVVAKALCRKFRQPEPDFFQVISIRRNVTQDAIKSGKLLCHSHVYDGDMNADPSDAPPCAGLKRYLAEHSK